jgi:hypothetical protein
MPIEKAADQQVGFLGSAMPCAKVQSSEARGAVHFNLLVARRNSRRGAGDACRKRISDLM